MPDAPARDAPTRDAIDDLFRRFGKAFNKADVEEIAACVTDDFECLVHNFRFVISDRAR